MLMLLARQTCMRADDVVPNPNPNHGGGIWWWGATAVGADFLRTTTNNKCSIKSCPLLFPARVPQKSATTVAVVNRRRVRSDINTAVSSERRPNLHHSSVVLVGFCFVLYFSTFFRRCRHYSQSASR